MQSSNLLLSKGFLSLIALILLNGCATSHEHFDCKPGQGVGCVSITDVNHKVNQGKLGTIKTVEHPLEVNALSPVAISPQQMRLDVLGLTRSPDRVIQIWVAPFQDEQGNFHEASTIHTVLRPGAWQVEDL